MAFVDEIDVTAQGSRLFGGSLPSSSGLIADDYIVLSISPGDSGHDSRSLWVVSSSERRSDPFHSRARMLMRSIRAPRQCLHSAEKVGLILLCSRTRLSLSALGRGRESPLNDSHRLMRLAVSAVSPPSSRRYEFLLPSS